MDVEIEAVESDDAEDSDFKCQINQPSASITVR